MLKCWTSFEHFSARLQKNNFTLKTGSPDSAILERGFNGSTVPWQFQIMSSGHAFTASQTSCPLRWVSGAYTVRYNDMNNIRPSRLLSSWDLYFAVLLKSLYYKIRSSDLFASHLLLVGQHVLYYKLNRAKDCNVAKCLEVTGLHSPALWFVWHLCRAVCFGSFLCARYV